MLCFTNNIPQRDGGTHLAGVRGALTRQVNQYVTDSGHRQKDKIALTGDDAREASPALLSARCPIPSSPRRPRTSWLSSEVRPVVEASSTKS